MSFRDFLQEAQSRLTPESVFEDKDSFNHKFKKTGRQWVGCCPWHSSSSGKSFSLNPNTLSWYCFGCQIGGGPLQYLHRLSGGVGSPEGQDFITIAKQLSELSEVPFPEPSPEVRERIEKLEARRGMLEITYEMCHQLLLTKSKKAIHYAKARGFSEENLKELQIGVFPKAETIVSQLDAAGYKLDQMIEVGIVYQKDGVIGSRLEGYLTFPARDPYGYPLDIACRWHEAEPPSGKPKTNGLRNFKLDGEELEAVKRSPLYLDRARSSGHKDLIAVEGIVDAAIAQAKGDHRVIASCTAGLTPVQIQTLAKSKVNSVICCYDNDEAGSRGTSRSIIDLANSSIIPYVSSLPAGKDPADFLKTHTLEEWERIHAQPIHGFRFEAQAIAKDALGASDTRLQSILSEAQAFQEKISTDSKLAPALSMFFWPEIQTLTGQKNLTGNHTAQKQEQETEHNQSISREKILADIVELEKLYQNDAALDWALREYIAKNNLKKYNFSPEYLLQQLKSAKDTESVLVFEDTHDILGSDGRNEPCIIRGILPIGSTLMCAAEGGVGKTTFWYDIAKHVALGKPWSNLKTSKQKVLVVQVDEPRRDIREKIKKLNFWEVPRGQITWLTRWNFNQTRQLLAHIEKEEYGLVIIDSITASSVEIDRTSSEAGNHIYKFRNYAERAKHPVSFVFIHHLAKSGQMRDSSTYKDNVSEVQLMKHMSEDERTSKVDFLLHVPKSRMGIAGDYIIRRKPSDWSWEFVGPRYGGETLESLINGVKSMGRCTAEAFGREYGQNSEDVAERLDLAVALGRMESEIIIIHSSDGIKTYTEYWVEDPIDSNEASSTPEPVPTAAYNGKKPTPSPSPIPTIDVDNDEEF